MPPTRFRLLAGAFLALALLGAGPTGEPGGGLGWRRVLDLPGLGRTSAVAFDAEGHRLAVGDAAGVHLVGRNRAQRRVLHRGPVGDLLFAGGALWVATERGLYRVDPDRRVTEPTLGTGAASRDVRRLARAGSRLFAATGAGVFASEGAGAWRRLQSVGAVTALAARARAGASELWLVAESRLYRLVLEAGPTATARARTESVTLPERAARRSLDVALDLPGAEVAVLTEERLLVKDAEGWQSLRPPFAPGALPTRLGHAAGRVWIATDRGLLSAPAVAGPWRRAPPPVANAALLDVVGAGGRVFAAGPGGLFEGTPPTASTAAAPGPPAEPVRVPRADPPVSQVHSVALRRLDLGPGRMQALRDGVDRRGWWPQLELDAGYASGLRRGVDFDQTFSSGAVRELYDHDRDRDRDWDVRVSLAWDLGDTRYDPESIDVSKESREVIELRDDVLDEITQLYFERQRALDALASAPPAERRRLALRADELAAGLDAWTGGWFGEHARPVAALFSPPPPGPETTP